MIKFLHQVVIAFNKTLISLVFKPTVLKKKELDQLTGFAKLFQTKRGAPNIPA